MRSPVDYYLGNVALKEGGAEMYAKDIGLKSFDSSQFLQTSLNGPLKWMKQYMMDKLFYRGKESTKSEKEKYVGFKW